MSRILHLEVKMDLAFDINMNNQLMSAAIPHQVERAGKPILIDMIKNAIGASTNVEISEFKAELEDRQ